MFFLEIFLNYILPIIYTSFVSLVLVLLFLFIFRIKDSNIRILLFFIPLLKPFIVIAEKFKISEKYFQESPFIGLIRFPDPANIIKSFEIFDRGPLPISNINYLILFAVFTIIIMLLIARWISLFFFYRKLAFEERVGRKDVPELYKIMDSYTGKIKLDTTVVSLTHRDFHSPFVAGIKNYTMVLSPTLIEKLNADEKETLIQHELSHIKRRDNFIGWVALILRDLFFFNPFAYIAYILIRQEQEKDSDKLMVKYSGRSKKEISKSILGIILKMNSMATRRINPDAPYTSTFSPFTLLNHIKIKNRIKSISRTDPERIYSRLLPRILAYIIFIFLILIQFAFIFKIDNLFIPLR
ncbi:MAG: M56 family metallopeptidase [Actinomycetota bacterium]|nr:M56 family metallopeptidase [Actinomycetota bacterium]